ncbi:uncharacterized protein LOC129310756 [Prosopis cineraria]|uniref:uncharacterized protein LOC129310756 n=1 Tax=Prosopis cineraria TaxID=364024 RepID=UPI0024104F18|nr:uncharacterized protein LOC129310756 [Prosopis cineraria]
MAVRIRLIEAHFSSVSTVLDDHPWLLARDFNAIVHRLMFKGINATDLFSDYSFSILDPFATHTSKGKEDTIDDIHPISTSQEESTLSKPQVVPQEKQEKDKEDKEVSKQVLPFPHRVAKAERRRKEADMFKEIYDIFKKVVINVPLVDLVAQVLKCENFLKELCTIKRRFKNEGKVDLGIVFSSLYQMPMPMKHIDSSSFLIKCTIADIAFLDALANLGAAINVMPKLVFSQLQGVNLKPIKLFAFLTDRCCVVPEGVLEDVLVKVKYLLFLVDSYVLDMDDSRFRQKGHSFLILDSKLLINIDHAFDVENFNSDTIFEMSATNGTIFMDCNVIPYSSTFTMSTNDSQVGKFSSSICESSMEVSSLTDIDLNLLVLSSEQAPSLELKLLPDSLKYIYLGEREKLPMIVASDIAIEEETHLLEVLKQRMKAIG